MSDETFSCPHCPRLCAHEWSLVWHVASVHGAQPKNIWGFHGRHGKIERIRFSGRVPLAIQRRRNLALQPYAVSGVRGLVLRNPDWINLRRLALNQGRVSAYHSVDKGE